MLSSGVVEEVETKWSSWLLKLAGGGGGGGAADDGDGRSLLLIVLLFYSKVVRMVAK